MRCLINSTIEDVSKKEKIDQRVIQRALDRQVKKEVNWDKMSSLGTIGIDEISLKKGYNSFVTVISAKFKEAHSYALRLTHIFNTHSNRKSAMAKINRWILSVEKSDINIFDSFINTLKEYKPYIGNYFKERKNSGFVEGLNNKIKVLKRRCYGLIKTETLFQRLFLDLQGFACYA
jgi:hypothetical protein